MEGWGEKDVERKEGEGGYENLIGMGGLMGVGVLTEKWRKRGERKREVRVYHPGGRERGFCRGEHVF